MIDIKNISTHCTRSEFVGKAVLDTIGLVISGIDDTLLKEMNVGTKYHCLGLFSSRTGAAGQLTAIDDAVKATNTEVLYQGIQRAGATMVTTLFLEALMFPMCVMLYLWRWSLPINMQERSISVRAVIWSLLIPPVQDRL